MWNKFRKELNKKENIIFYLSHSRNEVYKNIHISSWWMDSRKNSINSFIELERRFDKNNIYEKNIEDIFDELIRLIKELNMLEI